MSRDANQTIINQLSLVSVVAEDIAKAAKKADLHPDMTRVLIQMHTTQKEMENELNQQRTALNEAVKLIARLTDGHVSTMVIVEALSKRSGFTPEELFAPDEPEKEH